MAGAQGLKRLAGDAPGRGARIPRATYRLQLSARFTFADATKVVPYLADLGISHVYCSPYFKARPGSGHGYDVVDHGSFNPEIGDRADFEAFVAALRQHDMGHIVDFVPNHVGILGADNARWMDVLENGRASAFADFFDIDWSPPNAALAGRLLVPALGDSYGSVLERGELQLRFEPDTGGFAVHYFEHRFPLDPRTYPFILERVAARMDEGDPGRHDCSGLVADLLGLPDRDAGTPRQAEERTLCARRCKARLAASCAASPALRASVDAVVGELNGMPGSARSFDLLHELLEAQCYRLAYWRVAADDINYRRFFDVNDLAALRMERDDVFEATHALLLSLIREGKLDGLRLDHPDGLYEPARYFSTLQRHAGRALAEGGRAPQASDPRPLYLVVEKILAGFERLPLDWPVHGTTGYNFANVVNGLFVDSRAKPSLDRLYRAFIGDYVEWPDTVHDSKVLVLRSLVASELNVLANQMARIAQADRHTRDFTLNSLRQLLIEIIAEFPVYRTYVADTASDDDRRYVDWALARTKSRSASTHWPMLQFARALMLADVESFAAELRPQVATFARKFQQVTAPVTAKGVEDTALYRFTRLASLNEVGGEPDRFGTSIRQFHADARHRSSHWPHEMLGTSTHDSKRSEDVRARIDVLSEMPSAWRRVLQRWSRMNRSRRRLVDGQWAPGPHAEYLLYQTLLGSWPLAPLDDPVHQSHRQRIEDYMIKAMREAKRRTSWANVNEDYEQALRQFLHSTLDGHDGNHFLQEVDAFARRLARFGFLNSLSQTLCKLTAPGVPDIYQGNEVWDWSLVDPDNRRPVDFAQRRASLREIEEWDREGTPGPAERRKQALDDMADGRAKLYVTWKALQLRRERESLFRDGGYLPLRVEGAQSAHVLAYARKLEQDCVIVVVPRLCARLLGDRPIPPLGAAVWEDTRIELPRPLAGRRFRNLMDGRAAASDPFDESRSLAVADLLSQWPCALLAAVSGPGTDGHRGD